MDLMMTRQRLLAFDSVLQSNKYNPTLIVVPSTSSNYYSITARYTSLRIEKITSTNHYYGRVECQLADMGLVSGRKYKLTATIKDFSRSNLTGFIYIADNNSNISAQTEQLNTINVGDKLSMEFVYNPSTMKILSFYMNRNFTVPLGTFIVYTDIFIL